MAVKEKENKTIFMLSMVAVLMHVTSVRAVNYDCKGKAFYCLNSTHFMICVDLGDGVTKTFDDFLIPCPPPTVCMETNHYECEYRTISTSKLPTSQQFELETQNEERFAEKFSPLMEGADITTVIPFWYKRNRDKSEQYYSTLSTLSERSQFSDITLPAKEKTSDINNTEKPIDILTTEFYQGDFTTIKPADHMFEKSTTQNEFSQDYRDYVESETLETINQGNIFTTTNYHEDYFDTVSTTTLSDNPTKVTNLTDSLSVKIMLDGEGMTQEGYFTQLTELNDSITTTDKLLIDIRTELTPSSIISTTPNYLVIDQSLDDISTTTLMEDTSTNFMRISDSQTELTELPLSTIEEKLFFPSWGTPEESSTKSNYLSTKPANTTAMNIIMETLVNDENFDTTSTMNSLEKTLSTKHTFNEWVTNETAPKEPITENYDTRFNSVGTVARSNILTTTSIYEKVYVTDPPLVTDDSISYSVKLSDLPVSIHAEKMVTPVPGTRNEPITENYGLFSDSEGIVDINNPISTTPVDGQYLNTETTMSSSIQFNDTNLLLHRNTTLSGDNAEYMKMLDKAKNISDLPVTNKEDFTDLTSVLDGIKEPKTETYSKIVRTTPSYEEYKIIGTKNPDKEYDVTLITPAENNYYTVPDFGEELLEKDTLSTPQISTETLTENYNIYTDTKGTTETNMIEYLRKYNYRNEDTDTKSSDGPLMDAFNSNIVTSSGDNKYVPWPTFTPQNSAIERERADFDTNAYTENYLTSVNENTVQEKTSVVTERDNLNKGTSTQVNSLFSQTQSDNKVSTYYDKNMLPTPILDDKTVLIDINHATTDYKIAFKVSYPEYDQLPLTTDSLENSNINKGKLNSESDISLTPTLERSYQHFQDYETSNNKSTASYAARSPPLYNPNLNISIPDRLSNLDKSITEAYSEDLVTPVVSTNSEPVYSETNMPPVKDTFEKNNTSFPIKDAIDVFINKSEIEMNITTPKLLLNNTQYEKGKTTIYNPPAGTQSLNTNEESTVDFEMAMFTTVKTSKYVTSTSNEGYEFDFKPPERFASSQIVDSVTEISAKDEMNYNIVTSTDTPKVELLASVTESMDSFSSTQVDTKISKLSHTKVPDNIIEDKHILFDISPNVNFKESTVTIGNNNEVGTTVSNVENIVLTNSYPHIDRKNDDTKQSQKNILTTSTLHLEPLVVSSTISSLFKKVVTQHPSKQYGTQIETNIETKYKKTEIKEEISFISTATPSLQNLHRKLINTTHNTFVKSLREPRNDAVLNTNASRIPTVIEPHLYNSSVGLTQAATDIHENTTFEQKPIQDISQSIKTNNYNSPKIFNVDQKILNHSASNIVSTTLAPLNRSYSFNCLNRFRGKYSDVHNCKKFYICIGRFYPIIGECPRNTVFSDILKQCTRNLSHCVRRNQFKCTSTGRFSDIYAKDVYYICVRKQNKYVRFKLQCQKGYILNKESVTCIEDTPLRLFSSSKYDSTSKGSSSSSVDSRSVNNREKSTKKEFECVKEGIYPDPYDCRVYYRCTETNKSKFRRRKKKCKSDEVFHKGEKKCVDAESYECD